MPVRKKFKFTKKTKAKTRVDKRQDRQIKKILRNIERKHLDLTYNAVDFATDETLRCLSLMAEGDGSNQRTGLKVSPTRLSVRYTVVYPATVGYCTHPVRMIILRDKVSAGVIPLITEVLEAADMNSHYNRDTMGSRFQILYDKIHWPHLAPDNTFAALTHQNYHANIKLADKQTGFKGSTAGVADINTNQYYCLLLSEDISANSAYADIRSRLSYQDM